MPASSMRDSRESGSWSGFITTGLLQAQTPSCMLSTRSTSSWAKAMKACEPLAFGLSSPTANDVSTQLWNAAPSPGRRAR